MYTYTSEMDEGRFGRKTLVFILDPTIVRVKRRLHDLDWAVAEPAMCGH